MRNTQDEAAVRLYHLDAESGAATTLLYGTLAEAMRIASTRPAEEQDGLWLQTGNDVIAYLDLVDDRFQAR